MPNKINEMACFHLAKTRIIYYLLTDKIKITVLVNDLSEVLGIQSLRKTRK